MSPTSPVPEPGRRPPQDRPDGTDGIPPVSGRSLAAVLLAVVACGAGARSAGELRPAERRER